MRPRKRPERGPLRLPRTGVSTFNVKSCVALRRASAAYPQDDTSPLCCCEFFNRRGERTHVLQMCCACEEFDEACDLWVRGSRVGRDRLDEIFAEFDDRMRLPLPGGAWHVGLPAVVRVQRYDGQTQDPEVFVKVLSQWTWLHLRWDFRGRERADLRACLFKALTQCFEVLTEPLQENHAYLLRQVCETIREPLFPQDTRMNAVRCVCNLVVYHTPARKACVDAEAQWRATNPPLVHRQTAFWATPP